MTAEIITIGDEILIGQIVDTNAAWIAEQLTLLGITVLKKSTVSDSRKSILEALTASKGDIVLITGGLGPTKDDITKETLCEFFDTTLIHDEKVLQHVVELFSSRGIPVLEVNKKQAEVLANCKVLSNSNGTAPGMWVEKNGRIFISMPGVPFEMKGIMEEHVFSQLKEQYQLPHIYHKTILTTGMGEAELASIIESWESSIKNQGMSLAYLPSPGQVRLRITAKGENKSLLIQQVSEAVNELKTIIPQLIFGEDKQTLEEVVGINLRIKGKTIATAESCTGGYIAHLLTSISGSSDYFIGSVVSYSNDVKVNELNVNKADIENFGAVSKQIVEQMAVGVKKKLGSDYSIATSGIAGPTGGTSEKPVGTVWVAIATPERVKSKKFNFGNNRERNIRRAALTGLNWIRKEII